MSGEGEKGLLQAERVPWDAPLPGTTNGDAGRLARRDRDRTAAPPRPWRREAIRRRMLAGSDLMTGAITSAVLVWGAGSAGVWALLFLPIWTVLAKLHGLYDRDQRAIRHLTLDEAPRIAAWVASSIAVVGALLTLTPVPPITLGDATIAWLIGCSVGYSLRGLARALWRRLTPPERVLLISDDDGAPGSLSRGIRRKVELFEDMNTHVVAVRRSLGRRDGTIELPEGVDRIVIATERIDPEIVGPLVALCRRALVKLSVVSPLRGEATPVPRLSQVADLPVFEYDTWDVPRSTMLMKRVLDLSIASTILLLLAPFVPFVAAAIKLGSRGPVLFTQRRAGLGGRPFRLYKFRTMVNDAPDKLVDLVDLEGLEEPSFKLADDPRVTGVGRILRRYSIDEVPQLLNVLRGDMSIVGPRPEQLEVVVLYKEQDRLRFTVKPGVTGPMQVNGRGDLAFQERLAVERDYIANVSVAADLRILFMTLPVVLRGGGAY